MKIFNVLKLILCLLLLAWIAYLEYPQFKNLVSLVLKGDHIEYYSYSIPAFIIIIGIISESNKYFNLFLSFICFVLIIVSYKNGIDNSIVLMKFNSENKAVEYKKQKFNELPQVENCKYRKLKDDIWVQSVSCLIDRKKKLESIEAKKQLIIAESEKIKTDYDYTSIFNQLYFAIVITLLLSCVSYSLVNHAKKSFVELMTVKETPKQEIYSNRDKVLNVFNANNKLSVREVSKLTGVSVTSVHRYINE